MSQEATDLPTCPVPHGKPDSYVRLLLSLQMVQIPAASASWQDNPHTLSACTEPI
jgi:hypothetical protein